MSKEAVTYFAYGANADPEMIKAIVGREPDGEPATLNDFQLVLQRAHEIPEPVQKILQGKWSKQEIETFETYAIRRKQGAAVIAMAWELTPAERALVDNWELNDGLWYQKTDVQIVTPTRGLIAASTEIIDDPLLTPAEALRPDLPAFVNSQSRMVEVAEAVRADYLSRNT